MIIEIPNYLNTEIIKNIKEAVKPYIFKENSTTYNRDGNTVNITEIAELKELDNKLHTLFTDIQQNVIAQRFKPQFSSADTGYEYHIYHAGDICHYHGDGEVVSVKNKHSLLRYASVVLHLNTVHQGGELVFPSIDKRIKTEEGKLVVFPPYGMFGHYTTPSNEDREILVSWFVYNNLSVIKTDI